VHQSDAHGGICTDGVFKVTAPGGLRQEWKELYPRMAALHKEGRYSEMVLWGGDGEAKQGGNKGKCKATQSGGPRKKRKAAADVAPVAGEGAAAAQAEGGEGEGDGEKEGGEAEAEVEQLEDVDRDVTPPTVPKPGGERPPVVKSFFFVFRK
jgi:hypothetical protein